MIIGSHLDVDHIGGLLAVVKHCSFDHFHLNLPPDVQKLLYGISLAKSAGKKTGALWDRVEKSLSTAVDLLELLHEKGVQPAPILAGNYLSIGNTQLNVLNPIPERLLDAWADIEDEEPFAKSLARTISELMGEAPETSAENNSSVVIEVIYNALPYALLTADAGADVLREVTKGKQYPILKVSHHASKTGLDENLVKTLRPEIACIPVGKNSYGHPSKEVLDLLGSVGTTIYCSEKVDDCRSGCPSMDSRTVCFRKDRPLRMGWGTAPYCKMVK